jgi:predicted porin
MKKSLLALAVLGTFSYAASAQTNVTLYGVVDAGIQYQDDDTGSSTWSLDSGRQSGSRWGIKGSEQLGSGLTAVFTVESGFNSDDGMLGQGGRIFGRQAWVGLDGGFGSVKLGRQINPIRSALDNVDPFALGLAGNIMNVFEAYGERADNTLSYTTPNFAGFAGQVNYSFGEIAGSNSDGRQIGLSLGYKNGPIRTVLAHHDQRLVDANDVAAGEANTTLLGGTYDFGMLKAHAAFALNRGDDAVGADTVDSRDMMVGASAPVGAGTVLASYIRRNDRLAANDDLDQWALGYTHGLSKRTNLYTSYGRLSSDVSNTDVSTFNVGVRHKF